MTGGLFAAAACNALTGAGDLSICEGVDCAVSGTSSGDGGGLGDVAVTPPTDAPVSTEAGDGTTCGACPEACVDGACAPWPSCRAGALECGTTSASCCESKPVPGGTFFLANSDEFSATVSPFSLDTYAVTVGRFRAFVESGNGVATSPPAAGAGAHPKIPGSGWKSEWNAQLSNTTELFEGALQGGTFTATAGKNEQKPVTNVTWFEAFAFCAWDGGRLPTLAEWNFAAAGGSEQRVYPWSSPPDDDTIDKTRAAYECRYSDPPYVCPPPKCVGATPAQSGACNSATCVDAGGACEDQSCFGCNVDVDLAPVGSLPAGAGRYGQLDLSGNVGEIALDAIPGEGDFTPPNPCRDCALSLMGAQPHKPGANPGADYQFFVMNGNWTDEGDELRTSVFFPLPFKDRHDWLGFRCAR